MEPDKAGKLFGSSLYLLDGLKVKTAPTMAEAMPPSKSQSVLLVGDPVKVFDKELLEEFEASIP
jgi:hypothetical protein